MIYLIGGTKGGVGKSTLCTNLAAYLAGQGVNVLLIDADVQASTASWVERREDPEINPEPLPKIHYMQVSGNIYQTIVDMAKLYSILIIDAGGFDSRELRTALIAVDHIYVPFQTSQFDLETIGKMNDLVMAARDMNPSLKVSAILSRASTNKMVNEVAEAKAALAGFAEFEVSPHLTRDRKVYRDVLPSGRSVVEWKSNKGKVEIQLLGQEIINECSRNQ